MIGPLDPVDKFCQYCFGIDTENRGTAFWIGPNHIVSCAHVLGETVKTGSILPVFQIDTIGNTKRYDAIICAIDRDLDIFFASIGDIDKISLLFCRDIDFEDKMIVIGFSYSNETISLSSSYLKFESSEITLREGGKIKKYFKLRDGQVLSGFSGAPVINYRKGYLAGMMRETRDKRFSAGGFAIRALDIIQIANKYNIRAFPFASEKSINCESRSYLPRISNGVIHRAKHLQKLIDYATTDIATLAHFKKDKSRIICISGMPGVGKTVLAIDACGQLTEQFPDGSLYINLNGFSEGEQPVPAEMALDTLLRQIGVKYEEIPFSIEEKLTVWDKATANFNGIIMLDNAFNSEHVRQLIPWRTEALIIITSRNKMPELPNTQRMYIDIMLAGEARDLFSMHVCLPFDSKDERNAIDLCIQKCGYLPLALRVVGSLWANRVNSYKNISDWITKFGTNSWIFENSDTNVGIIFSSSFKILTKHLFRIFLFCAALPGRTFNFERLEYVFDYQQAKPSDLFILSDYSLIQAFDTMEYQIHDLLKLYVRTNFEKGSGVSLSQVWKSCLDFYVEKQHIINQLYMNGKLSWSEQYEWYRNEIDNIYETCQLIQYEYVEKVLELVSTIGSMAHKMGLNTGAHRLHILELEIAVRLNDNLTIKARINLANILMTFGEFTAAEAQYKLAYETALKIGDMVSSANVLSSLAFCYERLGEYSQALDVLDHAENIFQQIEVKSSLGNLYNSRGAVYWRLENYTQAMECFNESQNLILTYSSNSEDTSAVTNNIGFTFYKMKDYSKARMYLWRSKRIAEQLGNLNSALVTEVNLAYTYAMTKRPYVGKRWAEKALERAEITGNQFQKGRAYDALGDTLLAMGKRQLARNAWEKGIEIFKICKAPEQKELLCKMERLEMLSQSCLS